MHKLAAVLLVTACLWGCGSRGSTAPYRNVTAIEVDPAHFVLDATCAANGEFASYAATLIDVSVSPEKVVQRSAPTPCSVAVQFSEVSSAGPRPPRYVADLIGFDHANVRETSRNDYEADGEPIAPRWVGSCGRLSWLEQSEGGAPGPSVLTPDAGADAGSDAGEAGPSLTPLPALPEELPDGGFYRAYYGPQYAVSGRTVTLRGCHLQTSHP